MRGASASSPRRTAVFLLTAAAIVVVAIGLWAVWDNTTDDAFITFRYSAHLGAGHGPVWNVGEKPVEGYTDFLWMVLLAVPAALHWSIPAAAKILGSLALIGIVVQLAAVVRARIGDLRAAAVSVGAMLLYAPSYIHAVAGLETTLFAFLALRVVVVALRDADGHRARPWELPLMALLLTLTRPEGAGIGAAAMVYVLLLEPQAARLRRFAWAVGAFVLPGLTYFGWRLAYYGWPLPNTAYVKGGNLRGGFDWAVSVLPLLLPALALWLARWRALRTPDTWLLLAVAAIGALPYALSAPISDFAHRFEFHIYPIVCLAIGLTAGAVKGRAGIVWRLGIASTCVMLVWVGFKTLSPESLLYGRDLQRAHVALGKALHGAVPAPFASLAVGDSGAIPYYSDWRAIDYVGLNNEAIAHGGAAATQVVHADPSILILYSRTGGSTPQADQNGLQLGPWMRHYQFVAAVPFTPEYYQAVYLHDGLPAQVTAAIRTRVQTVAGNSDARRRDTWNAWFSHIEDRLD
jgi:hypothetical protein